MARHEGGLPDTTARATRRHLVITWPSFSGPVFACQQGSAPSPPPARTGRTTAAPPGRNHRTSHPNRATSRGRAAPDDHRERRARHVTTPTGNDHHRSPGRGRGQGDAGGLHPPLRPPQLPAVGHRDGRHLGAGRHRLPGRLRHRRQHRHLLRHGQRAVGHRRVRRGHLPHRLPARLLRRPLQPGPRPDHPGQRLRLLRLGRHQRHLRDVHVHLLRPRGLDHGPGPPTRPGRSTLAGLRDIDDHHLPAGDVRDVAAEQAAAVDHSPVAGPDGRPVRLPADQPPRVGRARSSPTRARPGRARPTSAPCSWPPACACR